MPETPQNHVLIVFLKHPEAGKVKTRLAEELGDEKAAEIYTLMAETVIKSVAESTRYKTAVFFDPPDKADEIRKWIGGGPIAFVEQEGRTLGERMSNALSRVFSDGAQRAVIIGTDCVELTAGTVEEAFDLLGTNDVVIGPARDGGYYLIGACNHEPSLFRDISWSTDRVLDQTVKRIEEAGHSFALLETLTDIDTAGDLHRLNSVKYNH